jgi:hypothetical protein
MTDISAAPFVEALKPYIDILVQPVVLALVGWAALKFQQVTGVKLQADAVDRLKSAAATQAGQMVAAAEDNLAGRSFTVTSPEVVAAANAIQSTMPEALKLAGASPEALRIFVAGELGKLQASTPLPAPAK